MKLLQQAEAANTQPVVSTHMDRASAQDMWAEEQEQELQSEAVQGSGFAGLSRGFLTAMQSALEQMGHDLTSADAMEQLAGGNFKAHALVRKLLEAAPATGVSNPLLLRELIRQWQEALQQQLQQDKEMRKKKKRPVWRCAACGRYGCPVAPYIESYQEVDE